MRRITTVATALAAALIVMSIGSIAADARVGTITQLNLAAPNGPESLTVGPDGNIWFTHFTFCCGQPDGYDIGRMAPGGGSLATFSLPVPTNGCQCDTPRDIMTGPDGNLWFTEPQSGKIGNISPDGSTINEFQIPPTTSPSGPVQADPGGLALGPDGNLWFTDISGESIDKINPSTGALTEYPQPDQAGCLNGTGSCLGPCNIVAGPDGAMWFRTCSGVASLIGRITVGGAITAEYSTNVAMTSFTLGPDHNLWFSGLLNGQSPMVGRITTTGAVKTFPLAAGSNPVAITAGPDGNLWLGDASDSMASLDRITVRGKISVFTLPSPGAFPLDIRRGPTSTTVIAADPKDNNIDTISTK